MSKVEKSFNFFKNALANIGIFVIFPLGFSVLTLMTPRWSNIMKIAAFLITFPIAVALTGITLALGIIASVATCAAAAVTLPVAAILDEIAKSATIPQANKNNNNAASGTTKLVAKTLGTTSENLSQPSSTQANGFDRQPSLLKSTNQSVVEHSPEKSRGMSLR